jgi:hypothetical protein
MSRSSNFYPYCMLFLAISPYCMLFIALYRLDSFYIP